MCKQEEGEVEPSVSSKEDNANTDSKSKTTSDDDEDNKKPSCCQRLINFYFEQEFLILVVLAILLARAYPPLGADYLAPDITATWIAVLFIFLMAGLGLQTSEFYNSVRYNLPFHIFVQVFNFGVVSGTVFGISRALAALDILSDQLADGMVVCASLPMTINMVLVLTKSSGGDEAAAIFNAAAGNMVGVFLSPMLILGYLGVRGNTDVGTVFFKLALRVVAPVLVGQLLQKTTNLYDFVKAHKKHFKRAQQYCLIFIVYTVFCSTFKEKTQSKISDIFLMIAFQFVLLTFLMGAAWQTLRWATPELRVLGLYGCTHKTVAMGIPLINALYEDSPEVIGLYTLPLLIWHPMQLVLGTFLSPRLAAYVERENEKIKSKEMESPPSEDDAEEGRIASESVGDAAQQTSAN